MIVFISEAPASAKWEEVEREIGVPGPQDGKSICWRVISLAYILPLRGFEALFKIASSYKIITM